MPGFSLVLRIFNQRKAAGILCIVTVVFSLKGHRTLEHPKSKNQKDGVHQ